jgi:mutual gliding-motility protein MglA
MVLFNYTTKELTAKIVYYGPGLCGKTTNLQFIYDGLPAHVKKGKMLSLATKTDRTLFFDFLPIELGRIRGMRTRVQLYTVPGQVFYNSTRKLVLKGADGLVFVADSQQKMMESNVESYQNLEENLQEIGLKMDEVPLVMQFNKRDLPNLASVEEMNTLINRHNSPFYEAVATTGIGVEDTLKAITKLVLNHLAVKYHLGGAAPEKGAQESILATAQEERVEPAPAILPAAVAQQATRGSRSSAESIYDLDPEEPAAPQTGRSAVSLSDDEERALSSHPGDLEVLDLDEELEPDAVHSQGAASLDSLLPSSEDLSELLEEIPEDGPEEILEVLEDRHPEPAVARPLAASSPGVPAILPRPSLKTVGQVVNQKVQEPASVGTDSGGADPLGILAARHAEVAETAAIQIGAVTPGKQHQVTVPLEMSVEGKKVRLQLKMTLTLSS